MFNIKFHLKGNARCWVMYSRKLFNSDNNGNFYLEKFSWCYAITSRVPTLK